MVNHLNVLIPSQTKIVLEYSSSQSKVLHDHDNCRSNQISWEDANNGISSLLGDSDNDKLTAEDVLEALSVKKEQQGELQSKTRSESNSSVWFTERRRRIKCGRIMSQKEGAVSLLRFLLYQKPIIHLPKPLNGGKKMLILLVLSMLDI